MKNGVLPICKPEGISSARVVKFVKKFSCAKKAGHMGTLDPFATGLLLCGINKGTRISRFLLNSSKRYKAKICLGVETDTYDVTGTVLKKSDGLHNLSNDKIFETVNSFQGKQSQIPPAFSALKHKGKPLYEYARRGQSITKPARDIEIFEILIEKIEVPFVHIDVFCSKGTYIRTIAHDIGKKLGCGAHLASLIRTETSGFTLDKAVELDDLGKMEHSAIMDKIIPLADALSFLPSQSVDTKLENKIKFGQKIGLDDGLLPCDDFLRIITNTGELAAIVEYDKNHGDFKYSCVFLN